MYVSCVRVHVFLLIIHAQPPYCLNLGTWNSSSLSSIGLPESATPVSKPHLILTSAGTNCQGAARASCSARDRVPGAESSNMAGRGDDCASKGSVLKYPSRAGPEAVTGFRHCPVIIRQVYSDETGARSGWEGRALA